MEWTRFNRGNVRFDYIFSYFSRGVGSLSCQIFYLFKPFCGFRSHFIPVLSAFRLVFQSGGVVYRDTILNRRGNMRFLCFRYTSGDVINAFRGLCRFAFQIPILAFNGRNCFCFIVVRNVYQVAFNCRGNFSAVVKSRKILTITFALGSADRGRTIIIRFMISFFCFLRGVVLGRFDGSINAGRFGEVYDGIRAT